MERGRTIGCELTTCRKSEVANLDVVEFARARRNEDVFWFQIPMHDAQTMDMSKTFKDLAEQSPNLGWLPIKSFANDEIPQGLKLD